MTENKEVMAKNIRRYMELYGVNSADVCKALGFKQNTFSNWINAKIYPRIDKIERLANYFNVSKADLVEPHSVISVDAELISPDDAPRPHLLYYASMLRKLSPEALERVVHYIEYELSKEDKDNGQS